MIKSKKSILCVLLLIVVFAMMPMINVFAAEEIFSVTNVEVIEKSETVKIAELNFENTTINSDVVYHKVGDYVKYKINIQNNNDKDYTIKTIADNNSNEYISYEYENYLNTEIKANSSAELIVIVKYLKENDNIENRNQKMNVDINVTLEDEDGNVANGTLSINPKTGDSVLKYIIILAIFVVALIITNVLGKKNKNSKKFFVMLAALILTTPVIVHATENLLTFNFKSSIALNDKLVLLYTNNVGEKETEIVEYGKTISLPAALEKDGYEFLGWYDKNDNKLEDKIENVTEDYELIPKWKANTYEIEFNKNGGTGTIENQSLVYDTEGTLTVNAFARDGYTFKNWNTKPDGSGTAYNDKDKVKNLATSGKVTLYAQWSIITYKISYNLNEGTLENTNPTTYTIETDTFTLNNPTKPGYCFTGWTGYNGNDPQTQITINKGSFEDRTYTANFAQYAPADLKSFNAGDPNVSWGFNKETGVYTITQKANSTGWGQGVVCDNSSTDIEWNKNYMLEFEIYVPIDCTLKTDGNAMFSSTGEGNDIYGTNKLIIDGVTYNGTMGTFPDAHFISGGEWHKVQMYLTNNNPYQNEDHLAIRSFSGFGLNLQYVNQNIEYNMRNLKSIVY